MRLMMLINVCFFITVLLDIVCCCIRHHLKIFYCSGDSMILFFLWIDELSVLLTWESSPNIKNTLENTFENTQKPPPEKPISEVGFCVFWDVFLEGTTDRPKYVPKIRTKYYWENGPKLKVKPNIIWKGL